MNPRSGDLWFVPLGGCGEIGMNMNLYGHDDQWLMVDCGLTFRDADGSRGSGFDRQMADPQFIVERRDRLLALLLTHAHEDHIGAVAHLWPRLRCPIHATDFTAEVLQRKLLEAGLDSQVPIRRVSPGDAYTLGGFSIRWVANTHSTPNPCAVFLDTAAGNVLHTGDFKLDRQPIVGHGYSAEAFRTLASGGVDTLVCDSTGATVEGHTLSEADLYPALLQQSRDAPARLLVACFGSNIARLVTLARVARASDRHLGLQGRSLIENVRAAQRAGVWPDRETLVDSAHIGWLPAESLLLVVTGSQGEANTALDRLSRGRFRDLELTPGDTVLFSARAIPGNEADIESLIARLEARGVRIVRPGDGQGPLHASGHAAAEELAELYRWTRPRTLLPVHGEAVHLQAHQSLARRHGIFRQLLGQNGDLFMLAPNPGIRRAIVPVGRLGIRQNDAELVRVPARTAVGSALLDEADN